MKSRIRIFTVPVVLIPMVASIPFAPVMAQPEPLEQNTLRNLNCTLRLTNDHVSDTVMMQDVTQSAGECRSVCAAFAQSSLLSMRNAVHVLRYTCSYRGSIVDRRSLK
jgi:hypothetical protein